MSESGNFHSRNSVLREVILEHLLIGEMLRCLWRRGISDCEILRSEFDAGGYDLVMSRGQITRHIQLKTKTAAAATADVKIGMRLAARPSGCVIWMVVTDTLEFDHFLWFGGLPGQPLPALDDLKTARHTKADATGHKAERPDHRVVPKGRFERIGSLDDLLGRLLGPA